MTKREVLRLENVKKIYKLGSVNVEALKGINLVVRENEFLSIIGPSGSGKSTLLSIMGLLTRPTSGKVFIEGVDTSILNEDEMARIRGRRIGFVFQTFNLIPSMTALENVMVPMIFAGVPRDERVRRANKLLDEVGLSHRKRHFPNQLSGGERQRVAIARALANDPAIILADEPTGNLDSKSGAEVIELFIDLYKRGRTLILVTHDDDIASVSKRHVHLRDGLIVSDEMTGRKPSSIVKHKHILK